MSKKTRKSVQTSKFAASDVLDEVKDKEVLPDNQTGKSKAVPKKY